MMNPQYLPPGNNNAPNNQAYPSQDFNGHHTTPANANGPDVTQKMQDMNLNGPQGFGQGQPLPPTSNFGQIPISQGQPPSQQMPPHMPFQPNFPPHPSQGQFPQKPLPISTPGSAPQGPPGPGFQVPPNQNQFQQMQKPPNSQAQGPGQLPPGPGQPQGPMKPSGMPQMGPGQQNSGQPGMQPGQRMPPQPGQMPGQFQNQPGFPGQMPNQGLPRPGPQLGQMSQPGMVPQPGQGLSQPGMPPMPGQTPMPGKPQQMPGQGLPPQPGMPPQGQPMMQQQMPGQPPMQQMQQPQMPKPPVPGQPPMQQPGQPMQQPGMQGQPPMQQPGLPSHPPKPGQPPMPQPGMQQPQMPGQPPMQQPGLPGQPPMHQPPMPGQPPMPQPGMQQPPMHQPPMPGQPPMPQPGMQQPSMQQPQTQGQPGMPPSSQAYNQFQANLPHMPPPLSQRYPGAPQPQQGFQGQPGFQAPPQPQAGFQGPPGPGYPGMPPAQNQPSSGYPPQYQQQQFPGQQPSYPNPQYQQPKRLDPDQMPSPIQVMADDQANRGGLFVTNEKGAVPPLVTTDFTVEDRGNASPRYIRSTMYSVPVTQDLLKQTAMPFCLVISPMAETLGNEPEPPLLDFAALTGSPTMGPVRCSRCKAYMCPNMKFIDGGRHFKCAFCKATTEVAMEYTQYVNNMQQYGRMPAEMALGAYEIVATKEYCRNNTLPNPPAIVFCLDVSYNAVKNGLLHTVCENIMDIIDAFPRDEQTGKSNTRVGFITYCSTVHFYNIKGTLAQPQMLSVGDVSDMFVPLLEGFLVTAEESGPVLTQLLQLIPEMFGGNRETETVLLPAVQAGYEALKAADTAGQVLVFHTTLPSYNAPGKLINREDRKSLGTEKEKQILAPQTTAYNELAQSCSLAGVSVNLFVCNNAYVDTATIGQLARLTGGQINKYTYFTADIDGPRLIADCVRVVSRATAHDAVMRVRTSTGVRATDFIGHLYMTNTTDVELAAIDADKAIGIEIKHDDKLTSEDGVYIQAALLYTHRSGQRRLRVLNLALNVAHQLADVYRSMELDTCINYLTKQAVWALREHPPRQVREGLSQRCAKSLAAYRRHCASPSSAGQLVLPESMKLLPLYTSCILRQDAVAGGPDLTCDDRSCAMYRALTADVTTSVVYTYPRLLPLHIASELPHPTPLRASVDKMNDQGVYLLENGVHMLIWVGSQASPDFVKDVFGVTSPQQIDTQVCELPELGNPTSEAVRAVVDDARARRRVAMRLTIMRQHDKLEAVLRHFLVEDRGIDGSASYVDYLCHIHKEIRSLL